MWTNEFDTNNIFEIRTRSTIYLGINAINKIHDICENLQKNNIKRVAVITGKNAYRKTGAWEICQNALEKNNIEYILYSKITPNPTVDQVDEATKIAIEFGAEAIVSIGGGSAIDAAKSIAILIEYKEKNARDLYEYKFTAEKAVPIITINLTHGTGTETNRFAVVSIPEKNYKPYIANDAIYPLYSIDDPSLMLDLPIDQTVYVSIDSINHAIEACTSKAANPYSILLAKETIRLVAKYLPIVYKDPKNLEARYYLTYASLIAGVSFDNGLLHFTHALEHPLSAIKPDLAHGLGLALLLPSVVKMIYKQKPNTLADVLKPIIPELKGTESEETLVYNKLKSWIFEFGITNGLTNNGFNKNQVNNLVELVYSTPGLESLISLAPGTPNDESVKEIYLLSL
jgi:alcohol dehydrogenase